MVDYNATGRQKRAITKFCIALGIREPVEEKPMTSGEAGRLIRELYAELRTSKQKVLDAVVRARKCKWCGGIAERTKFGLCTRCGRFQ